MTVMKEKLTEALNAKSNDIKSFIWKFARQSDGTQPEIKLVDASDEQLREFYAHCQSMLYNEDKNNPGRYTLLNIIKEQREKCNIELFLRKLESGSIVPDIKAYPRFLYLQDLREFLSKNRTAFPSDKLKEISIAQCTNGIPREFERIPINSVIDGCLDQLGFFDNKHITFSFILNMGVYLTPEELKDFNEKDENGNKRSKLEQIKERLNMKSPVTLVVKSGGLNFNELRAMTNLRTKKYSELTTDQLVVLRNKVLFKLENEVMYHITQWEGKMKELEKVAASRGISLV